MRHSVRLAFCAVVVGFFLTTQQAYAQQKATAQQNGTGSGYNWSGFYGGVNLGGSFGGSEWASAISRGVPFFEGEFYPGADLDALARIQEAYRSTDVDVRSFTGGLQAGYNFWAGGFLLGIEADINFLNPHKSRTTSVLGSPEFGSITYTFRGEVDANYIASLRPRVGILVGNALLYATGGVALTTLKYEHDFRGSGGGFANVFGSDITESASVSETRAGWTAGAGLELPIGPTATLKAEYLFTDFGSISTEGHKISPLSVANPGLDFPCGTADTDQGTKASGGDGTFPVPGPTPRQCFRHSADLFLHTIRLGINFKF